MGRGRPPIPPGGHGKVFRTEARPGVWIAGCRWRDHLGGMHEMERQTPAGVTDRYGARSEERLLADLALALADTADGDGITKDTPIRTLWEKRIADLEKADREPKTIEAAWTRWRAFEPHGGSLRVGDCTPARLEAVLDRVQAASSGEGRETRRQVLSHLRHVLAYAVRDGALTTDPTAALGGIPQPKRKKERAAAPVPLDRTAAVIAAITASELSEQYDCTDVVLVQAMTGLRISEILGITWSAIDLDEDSEVPHPTLAVLHRSERVKGEGMRLKLIEDTAGKGGSPRISLPPLAVALLRERASKPMPTSLDLVFPTPGVGTIRDSSNFQKSWRKVRASLAEEVPEFGTEQRGITGGSWRKTVAGVLDSELGIAAARDQLGHLSERTTAIYVAHRRRSGGATEAAAVIQSAILGEDIQSV